MLPPSLKRRIQFILLTLAVGLVWGQRAAAGPPFSVDVWSTADGLPQSSVIALTQTRDGYLWLGTLNGLVRFDGNSLTPFNVNNTPGLPGNGIIFLFEDRSTNLWVGTANGGLCQIQNGVVRNFDTLGAGGNISFADEDENGVVWFCTTAGRFYAATAGQLDLQPAAFPAQLFYRVFHLRVPGQKGVSWRLQDGHVEKFRGEKLERDFGPTPWTNSPAAAFYRTPDTNFLQIPYDANVTAACEDRDGNLVVGTHGEGVFWFAATGGCDHIATDEGRSHGVVLSLCFDREGNLWVGTK